MSNEASQSDQIHHGTGDNISLKRGNVFKDVNIVMASLADAIATIMELMPDNKAQVVEKLTYSLSQIALYQKLVNELKYLHNTLHQLEAAASALASTINHDFNKNGVLTDFYPIHECWRSTVWLKVEALREFAESEMKYMDEPAYRTSPQGIYGPLWAKDLIALQNEFENCLHEQSSRGVREASLALRDQTRLHLQRIDKKLLNAVGELDKVSNLILKSIGYE